MIDVLVIHNGRAVESNIEENKNKKMTNNSLQPPRLTEFLNDVMIKKMTNNISYLYYEKITLYQNNRSPN